jgi:hypothetical protein
MRCMRIVLIDSYPLHACIFANSYVPTLRFGKPATLALKIRFRKQPPTAPCFRSGHPALIGCGKFAVGKLLLRFCSYIADGHHHSLSATSGH